MEEIDDLPPFLSHLLLAYMFLVFVMLCLVVDRGSYLLSWSTKNILAVCIEAQVP